MGVIQKNGNWLGKSLTVRVSGSWKNPQRNIKKKIIGKTKKL